ncbi:protein kinase [Vicingaceae bacterium]|nr:protein kinase [Vicingaceae bacterium]
MDPDNGFQLDVTVDGSSEILSTDGLDFSVDEQSEESSVATPMKRIGRYRLLQQIGEGGMGAVWMAQQEEPVRRRVALKVIRAEVGSDTAIARFEAERQAVAMMDHQNIAKVLDGGTTKSGNPYFVMELVNGIPLSKYCDHNRLSIRERLELMIPVCRAIQHAHQKGIIHRDLKHANVLVTQYDGKPVPMVIDFGLAKALDHQHSLTDKTMFTEYGKVVGTLHYMSPEQAGLDGIDIDTRSDIYSLGVMIYKLLTGTTPLQQETENTRPVIQVLEDIREKEPPRPSSRLSSSSESIAEISSLRQVQPEKLHQIIKGDLDWIVMKALDKNRNRRYETANGLARDIERYLNDEEVSARPPTTAYRIQKFVKRNRGLVASMAAITILLLAGIVGTGIGFIRANQKAKEARLEAENARVAEEKALASEKIALAAENVAESQLRAIRIKSAWSDWQLGNVQTAWQMLKELPESADGWESRFLRTEFTSSEKVLYGHATKVVALDLSSDGKYIATGSLDNVIKIWNAHTFELVDTRNIKDAATCVRFSPDSSRVACSDRSNCISVWDVRSGGEPEVTIGPFPQDIMSVAFTPDGETLVAGTSEYDSYFEQGDRQFNDPTPPVIRVISIDNGKLLDELKGHTNTITSVACSSDGLKIVSGSLDGTIKIWSKENDHYRLTSSIPVLAGISAIAISPSGKYVASSSRDKTVQLWDLATGTSVQTFFGHTDHVNSVAFSSDDNWIVSSSSDRTARVWRIDGSELLKCQGHFDSVNDARFSINGNDILTVSDDTTARVWNARHKPSTVVVPTHVRDGAINTVWSANFSKDDTIVVSVAEDGTVAMTDVQTGNPVETQIDYPGEAGELLSVVYSHLSDQIAMGGENGCLHIYDTKNLQNGDPLEVVDAHASYIWDITYSPDGSQLASASADKTAKIWNTDGWSKAGELNGHTSEVASARFSPNGQLLVTASDDKTVRLWDATSFELLHTFEGHTNGVWKAIFSPDGSLIASSSYDGEVILWDVAGRKKDRTIDAHTDQIAGLAFSKDGSRLVTASDDRTIKIWELDSGTDLFVLRDKGDAPIVHVSFSNDGTKLVSSNAKGWVTIRTANNYDRDSQPFLPQEAHQLAIDGIQVVNSSDATKQDYDREWANADKCVRYYPSYESYTIRGIAEFRLGRINQAVVSLEEAHRLAPIEYGEPDLPPYIEGYLAMAYLKSGKKIRADDMRKQLIIRSDIELWVGDECIMRLRQEVDQKFRDTQ